MNRKLPALLFCIFLPAALMLTACGPLYDLRDFSETDLFPPVICGILPINANSIELSFNETVEIESDPVISPPLGTVSCTIEEDIVILTVSDLQSAGTQYVMDGTVTDKRGNRMSFLLPFYGFNAELPGLIINEFTTQGSTTHPDIVELLIISEGITAGLWIVEGTTDFMEQEICLPDCRVKEGDYILIHFKPQGIPEEIDETGTDLSLSGGYDASDDARDFWVPMGSGLSGNNGVIAVYSAPGGKLMDGVLYSNRTSESDENYFGFGSTKMLNKAVQLHEQGGWNASGESRPRPEDGVNPDDSTATRSMCRMSAYGDTDNKKDWHIVPTSSSSFGEINCDEAYLP
ncbi:MAG: hypothetical protein JEZ04_05655 [Spirochaetales bacterium]|nr:hypothetical protein [Spirochaetales bacterium]